MRHFSWLEWYSMDVFFFCPTKESRTPSRLKFFTFNLPIKWRIDSCSFCFSPFVLISVHSLCYHIATHAHRHTGTHFKLNSNWTVSCDAIYYVFFFRLLGTAFIQFEKFRGPMNIQSNKPVDVSTCLLRHIDFIIVLREKKESKPKS